MDLGESIMTLGGVISYKLYAYVYNILLYIFKPIFLQAFLEILRKTSTHPVIILFYWATHIFVVIVCGVQVCVCIVCVCFLVCICTPPWLYLHGNLIC